jgi:hypothetical protein
VDRRRVQALGRSLRTVVMRTVAIALYRCGAA